jgi:hypothetical protein
MSFANGNDFLTFEKLAMPVVHFGQLGLLRNRESIGECTQAMAFCSNSTRRTDAKDGASL